MLFGCQLSVASQKYHLINFNSHERENGDEATAIMPPFSLPIAHGMNGMVLFSHMHLCSHSPWGASLFLFVFLFLFFFIHSFLQKKMQAPPALEK
jgi:hypothetical protein